MIEPQGQMRMFGEHGRMLPEFDGATYSRTHDKVRLTGQLEKVHDCMRDGKWWTLDELASATGLPTASISARIRDFRKDKFGGHNVERRARGERANGLFEYRLIEKAKAN